MEFTLELIFGLSPFIIAWWFTGWPGKGDPRAVQTAGYSFIFFGISMALRFLVWGKQLPAHKYATGVMTTPGTLGFCLFLIAIGTLVLFAYAYFSNKK